MKTSEEREDSTYYVLASYVHPSSRVRSPFSNDLVVFNRVHLNEPVFMHQTQRMVNLYNR